jgi:hypothetical protein
LLYRVMIKYMLVNLCVCVLFINIMKYKHSNNFIYTHHLHKGWIHYQQHSLMIPY